MGSHNTRPSQLIECLKDGAYVYRYTHYTNNGVMREIEKKTIVCVDNVGPIYLVISDAT